MVTIHSRITDFARLTPVQKAALKKLRLETVENLLYHFPARYGDTAEARSVDSLKKGDGAVIFGKISGLKTGKSFKSQIAMADGYVEDETGKIHCIWFNQPYVAKMFTDGSLVRIEGKVSERRNRKLGAGSQKLVAPSSEPSDSELQASGSTPSGSIYISNPKIERVESLPTGVGDSLFGDDSEAHTMYPVYPESRGISSSWIYHAIQKIFKSGTLDTIEEPIPQDILEKYHLPGIKTALIWIHTPLNREDALSARKRFSFEEIFMIQLGKKQDRKENERYPAFQIETDLAHVEQFVKRFPFQATGAQTKAISSILGDLKREQAMSRLLEGDVGSGKTAVAAAAAYAVISRENRKPDVQEADSQKPNDIKTENLKHDDAKSTGQKSNAQKSPYRPMQIAYMCPTEILAAQHFESFIQFFSYLGIQIGLITGSSCRKFPSKVNPKGWTDISRAQLLKWVASGEISVLVGTHALIQKSVIFKNLAFVIIDEQHRFGTSQRARLAKKNGMQGQINPHLLSMTATPIPRTLALTMYGDLDLTILDETPAGRKPIITELVLPHLRQETYEKIRQELKAGRQAYVICPRIDAPDPDKEAALQARSVKEEAVRLKKEIFPEFEIGVIHGKAAPKEKDSIMNDFKNGKTNILCATSVVEVGVNVPNATVIIIEGAERFGLAQLHQLRGRVMRSTHQSYCYAFTETSSVKSIERLKALQTAKNGFELAELDLAQRGAGQLSGAKQWGVSDIAMEALKNLKMVEAARAEAVRLIDEDMGLEKYPALKRKAEAHRKLAHFE